MAKKYIYEVAGTQSGFVPNVGEIKDGKIESDTPLEGANFKLVSGTLPQAGPVVGTASQQNPAQPQSATPVTTPANQGEQA